MVCFFKIQNYQGQAMSDTQRLRISLYLDLTKHPELSYLQEMGSGRSAEALRLMAIGKRHEDYVVRKISEQLGDISSPEALREILFNPSSVLNQTHQDLVTLQSSVEKSEPSKPVQAPPALDPAPAPPKFIEPKAEPNRYIQTDPKNNESRPENDEAKKIVGMFITPPKQNNDKIDGN